MAEKEYIERNALIAEYDRNHVGAPGGARMLMVEAPAADVVEVVRCKDCKHLVINPFGNGDICCRWDEWIYPEPNDFCSYGERKSEF